MGNLTFITGVRLLVLLIVQVLVLNHINFLGSINPYLYILFIILFPVKDNRMLFLLLSFILGLGIDIFSDTGGIHAAASVFIAFVRPVVLKFSFGALYELHQDMKFSATNFSNRLIYISILTILHHFVFFCLEILNLSKFDIILKNTLFSSTFTLVLVLITNELFSKNEK